MIKALPLLILAAASPLAAAPFVEMEPVAAPPVPTFISADAMDVLGTGAAQAGLITIGLRQPEPTLTPVGLDARLLKK